jgi:tellurite resistance protein TerC
MANSISLWIGFNIFIFLMLFLDLFVFNRRQHTIKVKEALLWTVFWMSLATIFCFGLWYFYGKEQALEFATGYLIEQSLSVDNLFVILMLFTFFRTPHAFQHKVLFWGILGAIFFRIIFILLGVTLIEKFHWLTYVLGTFLIFTSIKMIFEKDKEVNPDNNIAIRLFNRVMPVTKFYEGAKFFTRHNSILHATPLFVVLIVVETTDIVFAVDSIPAILAISKNPFIVYSSNIFAVLGLRSLYFALAGVMELFHFLHYGLSVILLFIGAKILLATAHIWEMPIEFALGVVGGVLVLSVLLSIIFPEKDKMPPHHDPNFPVKERKPQENQPVE